VAEKSCGKTMRRRMACVKNAIQSRIDEVGYEDEEC